MGKILDFLMPALSMQGASVPFWRMCFGDVVWRNNITIVSVLGAPYSSLPHPPHGERAARMGTEKKKSGNGFGSASALSLPMMKVRGMMKSNDR